MPDSIICLALLGALIATYLTTMHVSVLITRRADQLTCGVFEGTDMTTRQRWISLFCQLIPWVGFATGFLVLAAGAFYTTAKSTSSESAALLAQASAMLSLFGAAFWVLPGGVWIASVVSAIRRTGSR
ncbi:MAG: hypothetical protein AAF500_12275 [Myxococcota bacterium]